MRLKPTQAANHLVHRTAAIVEQQCKGSAEVYTSQTPACYAALSCLVLRPKTHQVDCCKSASPCQKQCYAHWVVLHDPCHRSRTPAIASLKLQGELMHESARPSTGQTLCCTIACSSTINVHLHDQASHGILLFHIPQTPKAISENANLHDQAPCGGVAPVVGVFQTQQDVLLLLHLQAHHPLHLLGAVLHHAVAPPRRSRNQTCTITQRPLRETWQTLCLPYLTHCHLAPSSRAKSLQPSGSAACNMLSQGCMQCCTAAGNNSTLW